MSMLESNKGVQFEVAGEQVTLTFNTVKNYLCRGNTDITEQEAVLFMNLCKYQKLNPFLNEAYIVKFKNSPAQIITSKEAYMKKAEKNKAFDGIRAGLIINRNNEMIEIEGSFTLPGDKLLGGWAEVYRNDRKYPYISKVTLDEYDKNQSTWVSMKKTMIRKVAMVQALREAFPTDLGALYMEEEAIAIADTNISAEVDKEIKENANKKVLVINPEENTHEKTKENNSQTNIIQETGSDQNNSPEAPF